jgi:hypothetical protein
MDIWTLHWRSSHEKLSYGENSGLADREKPRKTMVSRGHQHHAIEAVHEVVTIPFAPGLTLARAGFVSFSGIVEPMDRVVVFSRLNKSLLGDKPPLPAGNRQHDGATCK